jgi:3-phosphoshikimate 1-carboxyvinyltransferase
VNIALSGAFLSGTVKAIPSKSYAHRISICNFLAGKNPNAGCGDFSSKDIAVTEECLNRLIKGERVLDCGESGSTLRFLMPLCAALGGDYEFIGHGKLIERPNEELFLTMRQHGVTAKKTDRIFCRANLLRGNIKFAATSVRSIYRGYLWLYLFLKGTAK